MSRILIIEKIGSMTGDEAVAYAAKQANVDVICAYPITPQTIIVERLSEYINNGELDSAFIPVESEHSALSVSIGASLAGARVFTATASQGLALMHEIVFIAAALRCPIVMAIANRALSAPINIHADHSDVMCERDSGWIIFFAENVQEAYDLTLQAFKVGEDHNVLLPVMVNLDGFVLSHCAERVELLSDDEVAEFLPPREPIYSIDFEHPITYGPLALQNYYFEFKRQQEDAIANSVPKIEEVAKEYEKMTGRYYPMLKCYGVEDARAIVIGLGSTVGTLRAIAKRLRKTGEKVGVIGIRTFRPFPSEELIKALEGTEVVVVMDRAASLGSTGGPLYLDVAGALYGTGTQPLMLNVIYGLGGRDFTPTDAEHVFRLALKTAEKGRVEKRTLWIGVRG
ncbi:MAG: pyruvate ferredoxin oxidoreductase [Thermoprotei archaeon]|nr:MAG: pyruvate ferredoxin oxidoreductase [Thermoprotei archaeon]